MKLRRVAAIYAIIMGLGMIGVWVMLLISVQDQRLQTELQTIPFEIGMGITSDILTAIFLLLGGISLIAKRSWAVKVFLLSMGFLFYSVINAAGLYGQRGDVAFSIMFAVIFILAVVFTILAFGKESKATL